MSSAHATLHTLIDLALALSLAAGGTVALWYYLGDCSGYRGEPAVRAGADLIGVPALGDAAQRWEFGEECRFAAADNPADDARLKAWLEAQPDVRNVQVTRTASPGLLEHFKYDTTVRIGYERPGHLGPLKPDWAALGYRAPRDDFFTRDTYPWAGPVVPPPYERWVLWLLAIAALHVALLLVVLLRGAVGLVRGRRLPAALGAPGRAVPLVLLGGILLVLLVGLNEWLAPQVLPRATRRGWVWFGTIGWTEGNVRSWIFLALLAVPVGAQLFVRYALVGRWAAAGRPVVGALLGGAALSAVWLDAALIPLGIAVGLVLATLAARGVPVLGLILLHAVVNGALFVSLWTGGPPPMGRDPRLTGAWEQVGAPDDLKVRVRFADGAKLTTTVEGPQGPDGKRLSGPRVPDAYYMQLDGGRLLLWQEYPNPEWAKFRGWTVTTVRVSFEGDELVLTAAEGLRAGTAVRFRRAP